MASKQGEMSNTPTTYHALGENGKEIFPNQVILRGLFGLWAGLILGLAIGWGAGCGEGGGEPPRVRVSAAASLGPVLEAIRTDLEAELGVRLELNLAGSGTLTRQITAGAGVDAVLLAHPAWMEHLVAAGRVAPDDQRDLLSNSLVVVGRGEPIGLEALADGERFRRVALGDPASVPAGRYAEQALRAAGVWDALEGRRVTTADVRAALAYLVAGEVDAAVVYRSDTVHPADHAWSILHRIDPATHEPVVVVGGAVDRSDAGRRVIAWLQGETAVSAFRSAGFEASGRE